MPILKPIRGTQLNLTHPLSRGLVGCWMADGSNAAFDYSRNGNNGTFQGGTHCVPGKFGHALEFDGTGDYVDFDKIILTQLEDFTVSLWAKPVNSASGAIQAVISNGSVGKDGFFLRWRDGQWFFGTTGIDVGVNGTVGQWQHIVLVDRAGSKFIYVESEETAQDVLPITEYTRNTVIGRRDKADELYFAGQIDHVMMFNKAFSASEVAHLSREPFCMFEDDSKISKKFL